ncbi:2-keto-4-pentenoate hydratase [Brevibacillus centrosporus]|uniref:2-keto-4-pentenoate hydratase n=1 Tax=Brevibacillus centrosporus TaxID=54910 RepID=A0A1I3ZCA3_9BACL|nr:fumarylacetoacetate hydrolase family protein [Brevibacillus centrosporus]MEC2132903.1 fumarylacetoacetate hydrolase family protein [Brevibacillus centrosporus]RNB64232.1 2-keto-4-pentenoate hydratase [Brevibacillus centrosporus]GED34824.1 2-keto-4-pentenoate hydratase [Brevibacillus centrosporus]SFK41655.1 2-keto-4-pentenoate hydratase [Brevibacillus centrosporus]
MARINHVKIADQLLEAQRNGSTLEPLTTTYPEISVKDAYEIQLAQIQAKVAHGATVVGKKIGLTSEAMQKMFNVATPDYGHLLDSMMHVDGDTISLERLIQPRLEAEIGFVLQKELRGPGITVTDVMDATAYVIPVFEIVDSRIRDWKIKFEDTVADNGSSARAILGGKPTSLNDLDLHHIGMVFSRNGEQIATAAGAAVMGNPIHAVVWLANAIGEFGIPLRAGEVILSGALSAAVPIQAGDTYSAEFAHIGSVTVKFGEGKDTKK